MRMILIISLLIGVVLLPFMTVTGEDKGAETMTLRGGTLGSVPFSHHLHQNVVGECTLCHNLFPQVPGSIEKLKADGTLKKKAVMDQCTNCHKQKAATGDKTGPTKCSTCHKK